MKQKKIVISFSNCKFYLYSIFLLWLFYQNKSELYLKMLFFIAILEIYIFNILKKEINISIFRLPLDLIMFIFILFSLY